MYKFRMSEHSVAHEVGKLRSDNTFNCCNVYRQYIQLLHIFYQLLQWTIHSTAVVDIHLHDFCLLCTKNTSEQHNDEYLNCYLAFLAQYSGASLLFLSA